MREFRLKALEHFMQRPTPKWGGNLGQIDFDDIHYFVRASEKNSRSWDEVPDDIKNTFDRLGIPEAERKFLSGVGAQYESEVVYHQVQRGPREAGRDLHRHGHRAARARGPRARVLGHGDPAERQQARRAQLGRLVRRLVRLRPRRACKVEMPLQAYFRINTENMGQFERTLIIAEEGSDVHYIEGCTAPVYSTDSLHSAVVEIVVKPSAHVRYTTVQNWSHNVYNLVTKRAIAHEDATMEWVDGNLGSKLTMKYPSIYLLGRSAPTARSSRSPSPARASTRTPAARSSTARRRRPPRSSPSRSPRTAAAAPTAACSRSPRARPRRAPRWSATRCCSTSDSRSDTYPTIRIDENDANVGHEASVSKIGEEQLFYLQAHGLDEEEASKMIVNGFIEPITKELPMEYAVEMNRLIELQMEGSIG